MNKLIVIGMLSSQICYLNISMEEAIKRYSDYEREEYTEEDLRKNNMIREFSFDTEFGAYSVWELL